MTSQWTLQDAKNKFSAVVLAAQEGTPQVVTKRGVPAVVVVSADSYRELTRIENADMDFISFLMSMPTEETSHSSEEIPCGSDALSLREIQF
ncbi:MAG: type II toxin-antitoxin system Phd/YefM family antitoxin [Desulfovibrio sp.]|jgi:prevent-host-death family protein|nr:type II toxin-antitoxin system Phd/YefM family antitoxin [Desulfovibrio sp.]